MYNNRLLYIDIIKVTAIILVMMCHIPILYGIEATQEQMSLGWLTSIIIGAIGVPLFMMCTGALVLKRRMDCLADVMKFYRKNLLTIYITGCIWCLIYYGLSAYHSNESITIGGILKTILLINKPEVHLWYIRMILMYYFAIPFLTYLLHSHERMFIALVGIIAIITFGRNGYEILVNHNACPTTSGLSLSCYLVYLAIGYYVSNSKCSRYNNKGNWGIPILSLMMVGGITITVLLRYADWFRFMWYDNPFILIASVGFFALLKYIIEGTSISNNIISEMSKMTFGVYLCHMVILVYCLPYLLETINLPIVLEWLIVMLITLVSSFGLVYMSRFVPKLSKLLFRY